MSASPSVSEREAGRELDALIAEKVMGLKVCDFFERQAAGTLPCDLFNTPHYHAGPHGNEPRYSTDIAAAFQVVEKMRADTPLCFELRESGSITHSRDAIQRDTRWCARFVSDLRPTDFARADTIPHAICLAALSVQENGGQDA